MKFFPHASKQIFRRLKDRYLIRLNSRWYGILILIVMIPLILFRRILLSDSRNTIQLKSSNYDFRSSLVYPYEPKLFVRLFFKSFEWKLDESHFKEELDWKMRQKNFQGNPSNFCDNFVKRKLLDRNQTFYQAIRTNIFSDKVKLSSEKKLEEWLISQRINIQPGGIYKPNCEPNQKIAIIVPYRNRSHNLQIFLGYMHTYLHIQERYYKIYILEQDNKLLFNRAKLFNAGIHEILKLENANNEKRTECFIFHDVDKLPNNLINLYKCHKQPHQLITQYYNVTNDKWEDYFLNFFGGVTAYTKWQFFRMNGASNTFYGWGGEDDDMLSRAVIVGYKPSFSSRKLGNYWILDHHDDKHMINERLIMLQYRHVIHRMKNDGFHQVKYQLNSVLVYPLYTLIKLNV